MRAKPIFTLSLIASALALSGSAAALGLGKLTVLSALGQPLVAQIELSSATREEIDTLAAKVADPTLYRQNNLTYQGVLTRARVSVERSPSGQSFLKVTTAAPVNEPYLDLLVEVDWASGRIVREYTFLLDPPGVAAPTPVEPVTPLRAGAAPKGTTTAAAAAPSAPRPAAGEGYTVKRGDTLSRIAGEVKPASVSLEQMLVALFKSNANAFDGNNMNRLRTGAILTVPSAEEAASTPVSEAAKTVRVQAADWRAYRDRLAAAAPLADGTGGRTAAGQIGTAVQEKTPSARPGSDQLRVSREPGAGKGAGAAESAVAADKQLKDAQSRIAELERTLKDMQRAVELKNQSMAQLQQQADVSKGKAGAPAATAPTPIAKAPEPAKVEPPKATPISPAPALTEPSKVAEPAKVEPPKAAEPAKVEPPKAAEPAPVEPPKAAEPAPVEPPKAAEPAKVEPPKAAPKAPPKKAAPPVSEPGFFDDLLANTPTWAIGGGALAVLGGIAALIAARRRKTTKFEDSIISGTDIKTNTVFGSTGGGVVNTGENSLASDFSREGLGNIDTDEVDPIAEAEVYLAYGRDAQAEEILKDALKKDPQRQEVYLKLLEIHAQHNKPSAFETVAAELYSVSQGQGETWQKAVALGRQLDPSNPMFSEGGNVAAAAAAAAAATAGAGMVAAADTKSWDTKPEPHSTHPGPSPAPTAPDIGDDSVMDFKLDDEISISPSSGATAKTPADILAGANEALQKSASSSSSAVSRAIDAAVEQTKAAGAGVAGAVVAGAAGAFATAKSGAETVASAVGGVIDTTKSEPRFDLDFKLDDAEKPAPMHAQAPKATASDAAPSLARPQAAIDLDKLDLSFGDKATTFEDPTPSVLDGQWHDAATKLDLAKAYQEMGDVEGAREILQEVLHEGDDQQKSEAQALIAKLG